jgi:hydroxymethylpyrimidine pyrophosphatase-like HAD family hydrolase
MYSGTRELARELGLAAPIACIDGSHIVDSVSERELTSAPICETGTGVLLSALERHRPAAFVFSSDRVFHDPAGEPYLEYLSTWSELSHEVADVIEPSLWHDGQRISAIVALGTQAQILATKQTLDGAHTTLQSVCFEVQRFDLEGIWGMVVRAAGIDKGTAIEWIAEYYGVTVKDIVAVGDWLNDVPMLRRAGRSFAMGQAPSEVREAATDLLSADTWTGGGIAEAAERAGLL